MRKLLAAFLIFAAGLYAGSDLLKRGANAQGSGLLPPSTLWGNPTGSTGQAQAVTLDPTLTFSGSTLAVAQAPNTNANANGRLTVVASTPVMASSVTAQTTLYYAPYNGQLVSIYNGTTMQSYQFTSSPTDTVGLSLVLGSNWTASTNYDVFVTLSGGVPVLCTGPAWSSNTSRNFFGAVSIFRGLYANNNASAMTCRTNNTTTIAVPQWQGTHLGTVHINASGGQIDYTFGASGAPPAAASFAIWNRYNRRFVATQLGETTTSWTYSTLNTWREAHGDTTWTISYMDGGNEDGVHAQYATTASAASAGVQICAAGIGINSTSSQIGMTAITSSANSASVYGAVDIVAPVGALGFYAIAAIENQTGGAGACTFLGSSAGVNSQLSFHFFN